MGEQFGQKSVWIGDAQAVYSERAIEETLHAKAEILTPGEAMSPFLNAGIPLLSTGRDLRGPLGPWFPPQAAHWGRLGNAKPSTVGSQLRRVQFGGSGERPGPQVIVTVQPGSRASS